MKRSARVLLVILGVLLAAWAATPWLVRRALLQVALKAERSGYSAAFEEVKVDLLGRRIEVTGAEVGPQDGSGDTSTYFRVSARSITLADVDLPALLFRRVLHVGGLAIEAPRVEHHVRITKRPATRVDTTAREGGLRPSLIRVDELRITEASGFSKVIGSRDTTLRVQRLDVLVQALSMAQPDPGPTHVGVGSVQLRLDGASSRLEPFYTLAIDSIRIAVPEDSVVVFGAHLTPSVTPEGYHRMVDDQVELYAFHADTILVAHFDPGAALGSGAILAETLYIGGATATIHRDKSIPFTSTPPRKPLLAETIQELSLPLRIDHVQVNKGRITYHERLERDSEYGSVTFGDVHGTLTGLSNLTPDGRVVINLQGRTHLWDRSTAVLDLRMEKGDGPVQVDMEVRLHELPATELSRMTDDLVHVRATEGRIHQVWMRMRGDDVSARGSVEMHYEGLVLQVAPSRRHSGLLSFAANRLVRSSNMPLEKNYRKGPFEVRRSQEKSMFNYLWIGLREGMMEVMLPTLLLDQLKKHREKAANKAGSGE